MKLFIGLAFFILAFTFISSSQTTHIIEVSGFTFVPSDLSISVGDKVEFNGSSDHPVLEVSMDTWNANSNTALSGGFSFSSGKGEITFTQEGSHYFICENHYASGMKGTITVSTATSSENILSRNKFSVYPNPLKTDVLTVSYNQNLNSEFYIEIFDITGKSRIRTFNYTINQKVLVDCSNLLSGMYIIQFHSNTDTYTSKFIKE